MSDDVVGATNGTERQREASAPSSESLHENGRLPAPSSLMPRQDALPPTLGPRLISREAAAAYICVSPNTFDGMVREGRMPRPRLLGERRRAWDVREQISPLINCLLKAIMPALTRRGCRCSEGYRPTLSAITSRAILTCRFDAVRDNASACPTIPQVLNLSLPIRSHSSVNPNLFAIELFKPHPARSRR
jgi:predicted DNA-binding transcriptional regulator AlpA